MSSLFFIPWVGIDGNSDQRGKKKIRKRRMPADHLSTTSRRLLALVYRVSSTTKARSWLVKDREKAECQGLKVVLLSPQLLQNTPPITTDYTEPYYH